MMNKNETDTTQELPFKMTNAVWKRLHTFLINKHSRCVDDPVKCRLFFSAIIWITEENLSWAAIPKVYGSWKTIYNRFRRWCNIGIFESMREHFHSDEEISTILNTLFTSSVYAKTLRIRIVNSLKNQGFKVKDNKIELPQDLDKDKIRELHTEAVRHKIDENKKRLMKHEPFLLERFACGEEIVPEKIDPKLVEVHSGTENALLFRYAGLHWSIPVSSGYGRRLRFLVVDQYTDKIMGLFGLGDPVFSLRHRDQWIGWNSEDRNERLHHVMDAFVLGAVPPYSFLLGGKLIALFVTSNEVREAFKQKYNGKKSVIRERKQSGEIALITTTSALGCSSLYNRIRFNDRLAFQCLGCTNGFGSFHFSNGIYDALTVYAKSNATATANHKSWAKGFRNRKEVVLKSLSKLGLPRNWVNHGIKREIYVAPLAENTCAFLRGNVQKLNYYDQPIDELFSWFHKERLLPYSGLNEHYRTWHPKEWKIWGDNNDSVYVFKRTNFSIKQSRKKKVKTGDSEIDQQRLVVSAIEKRQELESTFGKHKLSKHLTYEEFVDECISKRIAFTTTSRTYAISKVAIKGYSNHLRGIRSVIADFDKLIKAINYGDEGAAWIRKRFDELESRKISTANFSK